MRIYHVATLADWKLAQETGTYATSTYGRSLDEVGFVHAAYHDQVPMIRDVLYADVPEPLVVLEIETERLDAEVRDEADGDQTFPHIYGPVPTAAVVAWRPARLPPIDLGTSHATRTRAPRLVVAFRGLAVVLASAALAAFVCAVIAQSSTDDGDLPLGVSFVLWSLMAVLAVAALVALGYARWVARPGAPNDA